MEDLTSKPAVPRYYAPQMTQYGIKLPCRVAAVGQTDSGKTHSIMHSWLGGNISFWRPDLLDGSPRNASLQHCLFCSNGGMSPSEKETLLERFVKTKDQRLFHVPWFPTKQEVYDFISVTSTLPAVITKKKKDGKKIVTTPDAEDIVYGEDERLHPTEW